MGWTNSHLHNFTIGDHLYGTHIDDYPEDELDESEYRARGSSRRVRGCPEAISEGGATDRSCTGTSGRRKPGQFAAGAKRTLCRPASDASRPNVLRPLADGLAHPTTDRTTRGVERGATRSARVAGGKLTAPSPGISPPPEPSGPAIVEISHRRGHGGRGLRVAADPHDCRSDGAGARFGLRACRGAGVA